MNLDAKTYQNYVKAYAKKSPSPKNCIAAFLVGGSICLLAEGFYRLYLHLGLAEASVRILTPVTIIVLTAIATGFGVFDCLAKFAGAGTLVPISGFANAVTSPAIDNKAEGLVMGVGAKMFIIAGPVIVYGTLASVIWGVIYYFLHGRGIV
ncbi:MAG: SpoVA/SpoVAEb family sporulation membrane protein [Clostridia bacterium]|nr:SpoVA/SpoVAEb family sporulation membrane protein [Clostridia bacterium]